MKTNYRSFFGLISSHTYKATLLSLILLILFQGFTFFQQGTQQATQWMPLYLWMDNPRLKFSYLAVNGVLFMVSTLFVPCKSSKYTLKRLGFPLNRVFLTISAHAFVTFFIVWGIQALIFLCGCAVYCLTTPEFYLNPQTLFINHLQSPFFHTIFPTMDYSLYFLMFTRFLLLSLACGTISLRILLERNNKISYICGMFVLFSFFIPQVFKLNWIVSGFLLFWSLILLRGGMKHGA